MIYKKYGSTGLTVSAIGFGGMRFDMNNDEAQHIDLIRYGYEKGINYFDTAPGYCSDKSEIWFGKALSTLPREKVVIATKLMPEHIKTKSEALDRIKRSCDRLQTDHIDLFHAWNFRTMEQYQDCIRPDGLYEAMQEAQAAGMIKHLAFSTHLTGAKASEVIDETIEEQAKEQSNIRKMAEDLRKATQTREKIKEIIKRLLLAVIIGALVSFAIIKFKTIGLATILTILLVYHFMPTKKEE